MIGFHGCDKSIYEKVLHNHESLSKSKNDYDWLGHGIYFWEHNLGRALDWAMELKKRDKIKEPTVIGAIIDLGYCLNLLDTMSINNLRKQYAVFKYEMELSGKELPENQNIGDNSDLLLRNLDCAVIQHLHTDRKSSKQSPYDSVRGVFIEGQPIYENSGFMEKAHIQLCIRNPNCIKGYFSPAELNEKFSLP